MSFAERYGPWAVIAGASEGTGSAFAHKVASEGLNCILLARREGPLGTLAAEVRKRHGVECVTASVDLSAANATERIAEVIGGRDVGLFINNAGADSIGARFLEASIADWDGLVMRNVVTAMRNCYYFGKTMSARGRGGIILVGSGACYGGIAGISVYCASKAFDLCLGEGLWAELKPRGVDVLNLILGKTDTPAFRELLERKGLQNPTDWASPDDVARVGLERLPHGPVHNWALADDDAGYAGTSAATRRQRVIAVSGMSPGDPKGKRP